MLKYGMELYVQIAIAAILSNVGTNSVRSLTAKTWEDRPLVLRQIEQIGEKSIKVDPHQHPITMSLY
jgi:ATP-dependent DNA helicase HFM1/MER3